MQGRSWMAALTLVAAVAGVSFAPGALAVEPTPIKQKVKLSLRLVDVADDSEITIKPGHAGCRFEPVKFKVGDKPADMYNVINLPPMDVETVSADRGCMFAITLKERGKPDKTVQRILKIVPDVEGKPAAPQSLRCYVSANDATLPVASDSAKSDETKRKK